ncbi:MAG: M24 family metallopeptidase [Chloroflexota bacterium]|nr:M24 family metallopeptidase [Chloroflexota bacterium]
MIRRREELGRARAALAAAGCDYALLSSLANVTYASQWEVPVPLGAGAELAWGGPLLLVAARDEAAWLIVPNGSESAARAEAAVDGIIGFETFDSFTATDARQSYLDAIRAVMRAAGLAGAAGVLAVEGRTLPRAVGRLLATELPDWSFFEAEGPLQAARATKTEREIGLLRHAAHLGDVAQTTLAGLCGEPGSTEFEMWGEISTRVFTAAGRDIPLSGELVTGPRATTVEYPNGPRDRITKTGDVALMDLSGRANGYWFDCTNTYLIGDVEPDEEQLRYARASRQACEAAMAALRPGALARDAAAAAEAAFARHGLPMAHYAGHQIGVTVNELPRLVPYDETVIVPGMVFSVEPGAYQGPGGSFGARSEKMVLVTEHGPEIMSRFAWGI